MTVNEVYIIWRRYKMVMVKDSTLAAYDIIYKNKIHPYFGESDVSNIGKKEVTEFMLKMRDGGMSVKSCADVRIVLNMIIQYAASEFDLAVKSTRWTMEWPSKYKSNGAVKGICRYSEEEVQKIFRYALNNPSTISLAIMLTLNTGIRIGELCALRWEDVDIDEKCIEIKRTVERVYDVYSGKTKLTFHEGKTENSLRKIPLTGEMYKMMKDWSHVVKPEYYVATGTPKVMEPRTFRSYYKRFILEKVGLRKCIKFHGIRHTFASMLVESEVPIKIVADLLGHANITTTLNVYSHPSDESKRMAVQKKMSSIYRKSKNV